MEEKVQQESPKELSIFDEDDKLLEHDREIYRAGVGKARKALFFVGAMMFAADLIMLWSQRSQQDDVYLYSILGADVIILAVFVGLGIWTRRKPYTAILTGLIFFCVIQILAMIGDPTNIYKGLLVKGIVIVTLISGLKKARALQQLERRFVE